MEQLSGGFTLEISPGAFPLGTDSIALAGFARLPRKKIYEDFVKQALHFLKTMLE